MDDDTMKCGAPDGCKSDEYNDYVARIMGLPPGVGAKRESTPQRDARERGEKRFNARGCK